MKSLRHSTLLLLSVLAPLLPAAAHGHTYQVIAADVPFKFTAGERTFRPGHYEFILVGPGLMAMRDHRQHVVASLVTRSSDTAQPLSTRLVFDRSKKKARLKMIYVENRGQVLEVIGDQLAVRSTSPPAPPLAVEAPSSSQRTDGARLR